MCDAAQEPPLDNALALSSTSNGKSVSFFTWGSIPDPGIDATSGASVPQRQKITPRWEGTGHISAIIVARIHGVQGRLDLNLGHWNTYHIHS